MFPTFSDVNFDDFIRLLSTELSSVRWHVIAEISLSDFRKELNKLFSKQYDSYFAERVLFAYDCMIKKYICNDVNDIDKKLIIENLCDVIPNMHSSEKQIIKTMFDDIKMNKITTYHKIYKHGLTIHCVHYNDLVDGVIECKCLLKSNVSYNKSILAVLYISYNFYDNTYDMNILQKASTIEPVQKGSNTFAFVAQNKWFEKEQWIFQINRDCNAHFQYSHRYSFRISLDIFRCCGKSLVKTHNNMTFILCLPVKYYDVRIHVFIQTVLHFYNVYVPNEIISLIFYSYDTKYFNNYAEPFVCGNLQIELEHFHDLRAKLSKCGMGGWNEDTLIMDDVYLVTDDNIMNPQQCNINGIGLILTLKDDTVTDTNYPRLFKMLQENNINTSDLTGIWTVNRASELFSVQCIYSQIKGFLNENELEDKIQINLKVLVDKNIVDDNRFLMLWINWKRHLCHRRAESFESFDFYHRQNNEFERFEYFDFYHRQNNESLSEKTAKCGTVMEEYESTDNCNWQYSALLFDCNSWKDRNHGMHAPVPTDIKCIFKYNNKLLKKVTHNYRGKKMMSKKCQHKKRKYTKKSHKFMYHRW